MVNTTNLPPSVKKAIDDAPPPPKTNQTIGQAYTSRSKSRGGGESSSPSISNLAQAGGIQDEVKARQQAKDDAQAKAQAQAREQEQIKAKARKELIASEQALALAIFQQEVKFSPKAEALRSQELAKAKQGVNQPTPSSVYLAGGTIRAESTVYPFSPEKAQPQFFGDTQEQTENIQLAPEIGAEVRYNLQNKPIQQTELNYNLANLNKYSYSNYSTIEEAKPFYGKQINTALDIVLVEQAKTQESNNIFYKAKKGIDLAIDKGLALEIDQGKIRLDEKGNIDDKYNFKSSIKSNALILIGTGAKIAYDTTIGIPESIATRGVLGTVDAYNPGNIITAIKSDTLFKSKTLSGRIAEGTGIVIGAQIGGGVTQGLFKKGYNSLKTKGYNNAIKNWENSLKDTTSKDYTILKKLDKAPDGEILPYEIQTRNTALNYEKAQTTFSKTTESIPPVARVTTNLKTGKVKAFDPVKSELPQVYDAQGNYIGASKRLGAERLAEFNKAQTNLNNPTINIYKDLKTGEIKLNSFEGIAPQPNTPTIPKGYTQESITVNGLKVRYLKEAPITEIKTGSQANLNQPFKQTAYIDIKGAFNMEGVKVEYIKETAEISRNAPIVSPKNVLNDFQFSGNPLKDARLSAWEKIGALADKQPIYSTAILTPPTQEFINAIKEGATSVITNLKNIDISFSPVIQPIPIYEDLLTPPKVNTEFLNPPTSKTRTNEEEDNKFKSIPRDKISLKVNSFSDQTTKSIFNQARNNPPIVAPEVNIISKEKQKDKIKIMPFPIIKTELAQVFDEYKPNKTPKRPPEENPNKFKLRSPDKEEPTLGFKVELYDVLIKKGKNYFKVGAPLPKNRAIQLGIKEVDFSPSISFKVRRTGIKDTQSDITSISFLGKFNKDNEDYTEKKKYRFDTPRERLKFGSKFKGLKLNVGV